MNNCYIVFETKSGSTLNDEEFFIKLLKIKSLSGTVFFFVVFFSLADWDVFGARQGFSWKQNKKKGIIYKKPKFV